VLPAAPAFAAGADDAAASAAAGQGAVSPATVSPQADDIASGGFGTDPDAAWAIRADGTLVVSGTGGIREEASHMPWYDWHDSVKSFTVTGTVFAVYANGWFLDCHNLASVSIPSGFLGSCHVFDDMFSGCTSLREVDIPSGFPAGQSSKSMDGMFRNCTSLEKVSFPSDLWGHDVFTFNYTFSGCTALKSVEFGGGLTEARVQASNGMFENCASLSSISLPNGFGNDLVYAAGMFQGCSHVQSVYLPDAFGQNATDLSNLFSGCTALASLDLSRIDMRKAQKVTGMLDGCTGLARIDLGPYCTFKGSDGGVSYMLPVPPSMYRSWQAVGSGTAAVPTGGSWASDVLAARYSQAMADTYVLSTLAPGIPLVGNITISGNPCVGNQLVVHTSGMQSDAEPSFTWYTAADLTSTGTQVAEGSFYILQPSDSGRYIYVVTEDKGRTYVGFSTSSRSHVMSVLPGTVSVVGAFSVGTKLLASGSGIPDDATIACMWYSSSDALSKGVCVGTENAYTLGDGDFGTYIHVVISDVSGRYGGVLSSVPQRVNYSGTFSSNQNAFWAITPDGTLTFDGTGLVEDGYPLGSLPPWCAHADKIKTAIFTGRVSYTCLDNWFYNCTQLQSVLFPSGFGSSTQSMSSMFCGCASLSHIDFPPGFGKSSTDMSMMFYNCKALRSLVLPEGFGENANSFVGMVYVCPSLQVLDLSKVHTLKSYGMDKMISDCPSLRQIALGPFFSFKGNASDILFWMPDLPAPYCSWQAVGQGTVDQPMGLAWTAKNLTSAYTASMADTYVASMQLPATRTSGLDDYGSGAAAFLAASTRSTSISSDASDAVESGRYSLLPVTDDIQGRVYLPVIELGLLAGTTILAFSWVSVRRKCGFQMTAGARVGAPGCRIKAGDSKEGGSHVQ
jgi:hypothetical protein